MPLLTRLLAPGPRADLLPVDEPLRPPLAPATPRTTAVVRLAAFVGTFVVVLLVALMVMVSVGPQVMREHAEWIVSPTAIVGAALSYYVAERLVGGRRPLDELAPRRAGRGLAAGAVAGVVAILVSLAGVALCGGYRIDGVTVPSGALLFSTVLQAGLQAAIFEEIVFRGVFLRYFETALGTWGALGISALFFGFGHLGNPNATVVGAVAIALEAGLLIGALYVLTRSLWVVMAFHAAWNLTEAFAGVQVSGTTQASFLRTHQGGPELISGGPFGIEASLVTVVILGAAAVWLLSYAQRTGRIVAPAWVRTRRLREATPTPQA